MMKKLLLTLSILITAIISIAQVERAQLIGSPTTAIRAQGSFYVDSFLYLPTNLNVNLARLYRPGALFYQGLDSALYVWTGNQFLKVQGGGGGGVTNLSYNATANSITLTNSNGSGFTFPVADGINAGILNAAKYNEWDAKLSTVNLGMTRTPSGVTITNSAGSPSIIPLADNSNAGLLSPAKYLEYNSKISSVVTRNSVQNNGTSASPVELVNDVLSPGANMVYGSNAVGVKGWKPDPAGGGGGSAQIVSTTYDDFQASSGLDVSKLYYITTPGREGYFSYVGTVANQTNDNTGTIIVNAGLQQFNRWYTGPIYAEWFGLVESTTDPGATQKTANVAAIRAALSAAGNWERVTVSNSGKTAAAAYWLNDSIMLKATFDKHYNFDGDGATFKFTHTGNGFIIDGGFGSNFSNDGGRILGPGTGANDSLSFKAYTGAGVLMRNLFNSSVTVWEVEGWYAGLAMTGDANGGVGTTALGSQMNTITFSYIHHNYAQILITTYGAAGTAGNWSNESYWYCKGQLGRGIPYVTYGGGGWYGLLMTKDASSTAVSYGMEGHVFYNLNIEGVEHGIAMDNTENNVFYGSAIEPGGSRYHLDLDLVSAKDNQFIGGAPFGEYYFVNGHNGNRTIIKKSISGKAGSNTIFIGQGITSIPSSPAMTGLPNAFTDGTLLVSSDQFQGFSALQAVDNTNLWYWSKLAQYPTVIDGWRKYQGTFRGGMYKPTLLSVTSSTGATATAPANLGWIWFNADEPTTVTLDDGDDVNVSGYFEKFIVEYNVAQPLTIKNAQGTTIAASSNFTTLGNYTIVFRNGTYVVKPPPTGGSGAINPVAVGGTPNDNGFTYSSGNFQLNPADADDPGVIVEGSQTMPTGIKTFSEVNAGTFTVQGAGFGGYKFVGRQNGISWNDVNGTPNPTSTGFTVVNYGSGSSSKDMVVGMGKTATNFNGMGNNGTDLILFGEKISGGFEWRNAVGFSTFALNSGNLRGKIFSDGNWLIQSGGTPTNAGYKLDVQGTMRVTGQTVFDDLANSVTMMAVIEPSGALNVQPIPSGGTGGSSIFTAGAGTGSPYYHSSGAVNIGVNPPQSWAWSHWGPSCQTCGPGSTPRAIWEWSGSSTYITSPRLHSWDYNGAVPRFTGGNGIPGRMVTENNGVPIGGTATWEAQPIAPDKIDATDAVHDGDPLVGNTSTSVAEYQDAPYVLKTTNKAVITVTSITCCTTIADFGDDRGAGTVWEAINAGGYYKYTASGLITVATADAPNFNLGCGNIQVVPSLSIPSGITNKPFTFEAIIKKLTVGYAWTAKLTIEGNSSTLGHVILDAGTSTTNITGNTPYNLGISFDWDASGNSMTVYDAKTEIFRYRL